MITEDDVDLAKLLKAILEQNGYKVKVALDGAEAFDIIMKDIINLIITDLKMNWIEGDIIVRMVKSHEKTKHIPILVYTGMSQEEIARYDLEGVEAVIFKPVESRLLLEKVKETLLKSA